MSIQIFFFFPESPMYISAILVLVLTQYTWAYNDDNYPFPDSYEPSQMTADDYSDPEEIFGPVEKRDSNSPRYEHRRSSNDPDPRPTRGAKMALRSDYFVRFGRSKQDYLRFGRDPNHQRYSRSRDYLRFGRSSPNTEHQRYRREAAYEPEMKRNSNFLRFGRDRNFLRFGRNNEDPLGQNQRMELTPEDLKMLNRLRHFYESPLSRLFAQLESERLESKSDV